MVSSIFMLLSIIMLLLGQITGNELISIINQIADQNIEPVNEAWTSLIDGEPTTEGAFGTSEIMGLDDGDGINAVFNALDPQEEIKLKVRSSLEMMVNTDSSMYESKIFQIVSGDKSKLWVYVMAGRKKADSEVREVAWARFLTSANLQQKYETYIEYKDVRCGGIMNGWGKNCVRKIERSREVGHDQEELAIIFSKLNEHGYQWLKDKFPSEEDAKTSFHTTLVIVHQPQIVVSDIMTKFSLRGSSSSF